MKHSLAKASFKRPGPRGPARPEKTGPLKLVEHIVHGPALKFGGASGGKELSVARLIEVIQEGLTVGELEDLRASLDVSMEKLASALRISRATLHRRKARGKLDQGESERVVRFARLMGLAVEVLESEENARAWLNAPQVGLGGAVPLEYAATEVGAREVEDLLGRIEYGVYS